MREGLTSLLETVDDVDLLAVCESYDQLIEAVAEHRPAVVITDIRMPPSQTDEGIRAANHIREHYPDTGVVVLSQYSEPGYALKLFRDGAGGLAYLLKDRVGDIGVLSAAMAEVSRGGSTVDPQVVDVLVAARIREKESLLRRLSPRELEVLAEMAKGLNNAGIAERCSSHNAPSRSTSTPSSPSSTCRSRRPPIAEYGRSWSTYRNPVLEVVLATPSAVGRCPRLPVHSEAGYKGGADG